MSQSSIKYQFARVIALLIILLFAGTALFLIFQKSLELTNKIFEDTYSFGHFSSDQIIVNYKENLLNARDWNKFETELKRTLALGTTVSTVKIINYEGTELFTTEKPARDQLESTTKLSDVDLLLRIKSRDPSVLTLDGRVFYIKKNTADQFEFYDRAHNATTEFSTATRIQNLVVPYDDYTHAIVFTISYSELTENLRSTIYTIGTITLGGIFFSLLVAFILASRITAPLRSLNEYVRVVAHGESRTKINVVSKNEIGELARSFNTMIDDLDKYETELVGQERLKTEMRLAAEIEKELVPDKVPDIKGLDIAAKLYPATEIGGDCYDFFPYEDSALFYIGDATGHGVPAGLVVSTANAIFYHLAQTKLSSSEILQEANNVIRAKTRRNIFVTVLMARWEAKLKKIFYTSAGHEAPLYYSAKKDTAEFLPTGGVALGMLPDITKMLHEQTIPLQKNDVLVFYTDGIPEACGAKGERAATPEEDDKKFYKMQRFSASLKKHAKAESTAEQILAGIMQDVRDFMGDSPQQDDITLLVIKRK